MNNKKGYGLKNIHLNIRTLCQKLIFFCARVTHYNPNIIKLSETWLSSKISDNEIKLLIDVLYRADRDSRASGVAKYVSSNLVSEVITPTVQPIHFDFLFEKITFHQNKYDFHH